MGAPAKYLDANGETEYRRLAKTRQVKWWHEAIIDDMLLHPTDTHAQRAARLGYTPQAIMLLINSDMFKAAYQTRRDALRASLDDGITQKLLKTANLGLDIMHEKLEKSRTSIAFKDIKEINESLLTKLGYGAPSAQAATSVQVNVTQSPGVTPEALAEARARLRAVEEGRAISAPAPSAASHARLVEPTRSVPPTHQGPTIEGHILPLGEASEPEA